MHLVARSGPEHMSRIDTRVRLCGRTNPAICGGATHREMPTVICVQRYEDSLAKKLHSREPFDVRHVSERHRDNARGSVPRPRSVRDLTPVSNLNCHRTET